MVAEQQAALAKKNAIVVEERLVAEVKKPADAKRYESEVKAEADKIRAIKLAEAESETTRIKSIAEADAVRIRGLAEADAIRAKGIAEAEAKIKLAEAMAKYGEAAIVELVMARLPEVMREVAKPMEQVEKITIIDNGGSQGASKLSKVITDIAGNGFQLVRDMTGLDISEIVSEYSKSKDGKEEVNSSEI